MPKEQNNKKFRLTILSETVLTDNDKQGLDWFCLSLAEKNSLRLILALTDEGEVIPSSAGEKERLPESILVLTGENIHKIRIAQRIRENTNNPYLLGESLGLDIQSKGPEGVRGLLCLLPVTMTLEEWRWFRPSTWVRSIKSRFAWLMQRGWKIRFAWFVLNMSGRPKLYWQAFPAQNKEVIAVPHHSV